MHPGHRTWPTRRDELLGLSPFFVHFKVHDFDPSAFAVAAGCGGGVRCAGGGKQAHSAWIAFNSSGFATGIAPHHTHGALRVDRSRSAREQVLAYYQLSGRQPVPLDAELRRRCGRRLLPRCSVAWTTRARFKP